jgi:D-alanyl-D-alanine carboxypeptidase
MKKTWFIAFCLIIFFTFLFGHLTASAQSPQKSYLGKILIQTESYGRAWYVYPKDGRRYYLKDANFAFETVSRLAHGIRHDDLVKIPISYGEKGEKKMIERFSGYFLIDVDHRGELFYIDPNSRVRISVSNNLMLLTIMQKLGIPVYNVALRKIPMNETQIVADYTFPGVAYAMNNAQVVKGKNIDTILPLASLTKITTALVLLDMNPDWNKKITITQEHLKYPKLYVGDDASSEVAFLTGDILTFHDLWISMLIASSNQATIALVDSTGLSRQDFIKKMNEKAKDLKLKKTAFYEVAGLDAHNVSTPREYSIITNAAFSRAEIADKSIQEKHEMTAIGTNGMKRKIPVINRNYSLLRFSPEGAKTGYLIEAQRNVALKKGEKSIVILHSLSMSERNSILQRLLSR